jgi:hypothetical protein
MSGTSGTSGGVDGGTASGNSSARLNVDDLELELRRLPGVRAAGFTERDDVLLIQLQVSGERPPPNLPLQATRIAYRHSEKPIALEVVRWRVAAEARASADAPETIEQEPAADELAAPAPPTVHATVSPGPIPAGPPPTVGGDRWPRVRRLAVLTFPDTDELEVHLTFGGRRIIGRAVASIGILAVVEAMVDGLRVFVPRLEFTPTWARALDDDRGRDVHLVACELAAPDESRRLGIASGASAIEAAARATLHALNRSISQHLAEDAESVAGPGDSTPGDSTPGADPSED